MQVAGKEIVIIIIGTIANTNGMGRWDGYGHVSENMRKDSAAWMQKYI